MISGNLFKRIASKGPLTISEKKIADVFQRMHPFLGFETISSISKEANVSKATVTRFINSLGYSGFNDFLTSVRTELTARLQSPFERYHASKHQLAKTGFNYWDICVEASINNITETHKRISAEEMMNAARILALSSGGLYVIGQRLSYSIAHQFWFNANIFRERVFLLDNHATQMSDLLINVKEDDAMFAVTHFPYNRPTIDAVQCFSRLGGTVVLLTDSELTPLSQWANFQLTADVGGLPVSFSRSAMTTVSEALLVFMAHLLHDKINERTTKGEELCREFGVYMHGPREAKKTKKVVD